MRVLLNLLVVVCTLDVWSTVAHAQETPVPPPPTATPAHPFFITKSWVIGGVGNWDYLTVDPVTRELFIAHGPTVQVVNIDSGTVAGTINGFRQAHSVVLDGEGTFGYVSDGQADVVRVFDRHSYQIVANIRTGPSPRSMALDASSGLLFVVGGQPGAAGSDVHAARTGAGGTPHGPRSSLTVIDVQQRLALAQLVLPGELGFAQTDGKGRVYVTVRDRNQILRLDGQAVANALPRMLVPKASNNRRSTTKQTSLTAGGGAASRKPPVLDWFAGAATQPPAEALPDTLNLDSICESPRALAIDPNHARLFAACNNFRMAVIDAQSGNVVAAVPIGPGPDAIGYDANRGLIFTANGGGDGSLTIIRQDVTDTYSVIQTLPTRQHARTLAIDPVSGNVYLTSVLYGADMSTPMTNGRPAPMKVSRVDSSFQVLVVGN
jgi:DNA-binding beta-propeller fold protein YncE